MRLSKEDIQKIRSTRPAFVSQPDVVADIFYTKLFEIDPAAREMFPHDMQDQGRKLMATLAVAADTLENWDRLAPILATLARRHVSYGVQPFHYATVSQAFQATLEAAGVDVATRAAWRQGMSMIAGYMIEVAYPDHQKPEPDES